MLQVNLARLIPVEASEGNAIIQLDATIRQVQCIHGCRKALAKVLAQREIERGVLR